MAFNRKSKVSAPYVQGHKDALRIVAVQGEEKKKRGKWVG